jgi:hypothetical protein
MTNIDPTAGTEERLESPDYAEQARQHSLKKETHRLIRWMRRLVYTTPLEKELRENVQNGLEVGRKAAMVNVTKNTRLQ